MTIVDVNVLVHAVNAGFPGQPRIQQWLDQLLERREIVALPWAVIVGFVRVVTNPRAMANPLTLDEALQQITTWLALPHVSILLLGAEHARHFTQLCHAANATGNLVSDAHLAALAIEHRCELASNDADFARFPGLRWINPLAPL